MAEFSAAVDLEVRPVGLPEARQQIERELGDVEVGVSGSMAPTGRQPRDRQSGQFLPKEGPEQRLVDLLESGETRNELLEDIRDMGGAGGGTGAGQTLLQVSGAQSILGGLAGGAAGRGMVGAGALGTAGAAVGLPLLGGMVGKAGADFLDQLFPDARGEGMVAGTGNVGAARTPGEAILEVPEPWPPQLDLPGDFPPELQLPPGLPPELEVPQGFPPELRVPPGFPPQLEVPPNFPPQIDVPDSIGIDVPPALERLANGNLGVDVGLDVDIPSASEIQRDIQNAVENIVQQWFRNNFDINNHRNFPGR